jgi:tetratricopeptide (TPR) repeat protein
MFDEATAVCRKAVAANPENRELKLLLAWQLADTGKLDEGLAIANGMLKNTAEDREVYMQISLIQLRLKHWKEADDALAKALREIRVHGQERRYFHTRVGVGGRMDTLQCAVILGKLERFDWEVERRIALGEAYGRLLQAAGAEVGLLTIRPDRDCVWAQYTVFVENRDAVQKVLASKGIPTAVHYPLSLNRQPAYRDEQAAAETVNSHWAADRVMSLPMSADLDEGQMVGIVEAIADAALRASPVADVGPTK